MSLLGLRIKHQLSRSGNFLLYLTFLIGLIIPWVIALTTGNLDIPHNDAWSHSRIAQSWAETGEIKLLGWNRAALVGQIFVLGPFASSLFYQQTFVTFLSGLALVSIYSILKAHIGSERAGLSILLISIFPGYSLLSTSYMTDIPMLSAIFISLALGDKSFRSDSRLLYLAASISGIWGVTIREQAIAAPIAIFITFLLLRKKLKKLSFKFCSVIFVLSLFLILIFEMWRSQLPWSDPPLIQLNDNPLYSVASGFVKGWFTLSLITGIPMLLELRRRRIIRNFFPFGLLIFSLGIFFWLLPFPDQFFLPNYTSISGSYSQVLGPASTIFSTKFWLLYIVFSLFLGSISFSLLIGAQKNLDPLLTIFTLLTAVGTMLQLLTPQSTFDRNFLVFLPWILLTLFAIKPNFKLQKASKITTLPMVFALTSVLLLSYSLMLHSFAFDSVRWASAKEMTDRGIPAGKIYAGLEWTGWHSPNGAVYRFTQPPGGVENYWLDNKMFGTKPCFVFSTLNQLEDQGSLNISEWTLVRELPYEKFLYFGDSKLYSFRTFESNCEYPGFE